MVNCDHCNNWSGTSLRALLSLSNTENFPGFISRALGWTGRLLLSWVSNRAYITRTSDRASFVETYICANCAETSGQQSTCEYVVLDSADH